MPTGKTDLWSGLARRRSKRWKMLSGKLYYPRIGGERGKMQKRGPKRRDIEAYSDDTKSHGAKAGGARPTATMMADAVHRARLLHERSPTARVLGDPPAGYSALDKISRSRLDRINGLR